MKILITGASGFIGGQLVQTAAKRFGSTNVLALSSRPIENINTIIYDSSDFSIAQKNYPQDIDIVIHAGSFTPKSHLESNDIHGCSSNIHFTEKLFHSNLPNLRSVIYLSTLDVYAPSELTDEETATLPKTLYGLSKLYCERMIQEAARARGITSQILRIGHVYGPGEEKYQKFIPNVMRDIIAGKPVELWGDGTALRSYIFIDDVIEAILASVPLDSTSNIVNIVSGNAYPIKELLAKIIAISGKDVQVIQRSLTGENRDYVFDDRKCRNLLTKETELTTGLRSEYDYFNRLA